MTFFSINKNREKCLTKVFVRVMGFLLLKFKELIDLF